MHTHYVFDPPRFLAPDEGAEAGYAEFLGSQLAAEGAVAAYERVVGETWKPFERQVDQPGQSLDRKAAAQQMAAFG